MADAPPVPAQRRDEPTDRLHELRRRPPSLLGGRALGAVRRRPDVAQHRARVRGPPRRHRAAWPCASPTPTAGTRSSPSASCRSGRRGSPTGSRPAAWRRATAWRSCSSRRWPSTPRSSAPSSGAPSPCRSSRCSARTACGSASRTARRGSSSRTPRRRTRRAASTDLDVVVADDALLASLAGYPSRCEVRERAGRPRRLPVHVRHHARAARRRAAHAPGHRRAHDRRALRHRHPAGRPVLLPVVAGVGPRALARHAGSPRPRSDHRDDGGQVRSRAPAPRAPGLRRHRCCRRPRPTSG